MIQDQSGDGIDSEIAMLYQAVADALTARERCPGDPALEQQYQRSMDRLRAAQAVEAECAVRTFRDQLVLEPGAGYAAIEAARRVLDDASGPF